MTGYTGKDFNLLFSKMSEGVAIHELIFDSDGKPIDYRILDVNPSFETFTRIPKNKAAGARASEIYGTGTAPFLEIYSRVSSSGKPESFETYFPPMEKYFSISVVSMHPGIFATIFSDITEHKKASNRTEQLNQFLLALRNVNQLITHVKRDPQHLIDEITRTLIQSCNYSHVWIVLLNLDRQATAVTSSSPSEYWDKLNREFKKKNIPPCAKDAIEKGKTVVVSAISDYCSNCPLARGEITKLVAPLIHDNKLRGVITIDMTPCALIGEEELSLFDEMAGDIAFALSDIEMEEARIKTEKALAESEIRYRSLFDNSNDAIYVHLEGVTGRFIDVNDRACQLLGYSREEMLEMSPSDIDDPEYSKQLAEKSDQLLKNGHGVIEMVHIAKDGRRIPVELSTGPLTIGGLSLQLTIARDLTERKKTEAELIRFNKLYDVLSQVNQEVIRAKNNDSFLSATCKIIAERGGFALAWVGKFEPINKAITPVASSGQAASYLDGIEVTVEDSPKGIGPIGMSIRQNAPYIIENFMTDASTAHWKDRAQPFQFGGVGAFPILVNGEIWGVLGVYSSAIGYFGDKEAELLEETAGDIGFALHNIDKERNRIAAELRIQAAADEWLTTFDSIKDMVAIVDRDHIIRRVNRAFTEALKTGPGDLLGKHCFEVVHCMNQPHPSCPHARTLISRKAESSEYFDKRLKKWVEASSSPIFDDDGILVGSVHIIKDISARKREEQEKLLLRDKAEIASRLATVGEMAAGIAHEIITP
ncbi:PAS domain S-box protein [Dehalogenimonas etheniformans]|uniref:PAS domain S-box protein n=1 Tax=Dehalogenimonas etheniformans TaxID=1536648 RepID=UPI001D02E614|nr:PAS domain S-box protein [Dehalogenimonas etheniformans]